MQQTDSVGGFALSSYAKKTNVLRESPSKNLPAKQAEDLAKNFKLQKSLTFSSPSKESPSKMQEYSQAN